jgi:hypothetical protein
VAPAATTGRQMWRRARGAGLEKVLAGGIGQLVLCRWREGLGWPTEDASTVRADANSVQIWVKDGLSRTRRSGCVTPLGRAQMTRRSGWTSSDGRERDALAR